MKRAILFLAVSTLIALGLMYGAATADPVRRDIAYLSDRWPAGEPPVRMVFLSDLHAGLPDNPSARLDRLVARINALKPDCVLLGGDFLADKRVGWTVPLEDGLRPLLKLRSRIETIAVLGNHDDPDDDHARRARIIRFLSDGGVHIVANGAARCGPVTVGGVDDIWSAHADVGATLRSLRLFGGVPLVITHNPDAFRTVHGVGLTLAGHTHCGQIAFPAIGPLYTASLYGKRYACGIVRERGQTLVVSAGIGTSGLPLRWNAPADFWVITAGPRARG